VEERRRLKIIPNAFGEKAVLKLMFGAMIRAAERWRSIRVTPFECRQMAALREEFDQDHEAAVDLDTRRSGDTPAAKNSQQMSSLTPGNSLARESSPRRTVLVSDVSRNP
jgi:hypothetical protein